MKTTGLVAASSLVMLACGVVPPVQAQTKIAVVDFQNALLATAEMTKAAAELEGKFKGQQEELDRYSSELQELQTKIESSTDQAAAQSMQLEYARKQRDAQRLTEDLQSEVDYERNAILQDAAQRMREVLNSLREEKGFDLIVDVNSALSFSSSLDVTADATAAYNTAHPAE